MSDPSDPGGADGGISGPYAIGIADAQGHAVEAKGLRALAARALAALGVPAGAELSIALVTPSEIAALKSRYEGESAPTDVLSFPMEDGGGGLLGDVVLCPGVAQRQARALGRTLDEELSLLLVHGILHLLGRNHESPSEEIAMRAEERRLLAVADGLRPRASAP